MSNPRVVLKNVNDGSEIDVVDELQIGRLPESGLVLTKGHPSRRHAVIRVAESAVVVEDLDSANGTFVNEARVQAPTRLSSGDRVRFDAEEFIIEIVPLAASGADADKTLVRKPDAIEAPSSGARVTPAWINPDKHAPGGPKTEFIGADKIRDMMHDGADAEADADGSVEVPTLLITAGNRKGTRVLLRSDSEYGEWTLGSDADRDVVLQDDGVSGVHAKISFDGLRWRLSDQMSANGTYVNGKRSNMSYLGNGDRLRFGPVECVVMFPARIKRTPGKKSGKTSPVVRNAVVGVLAFLVTLAIIYAVINFTR